MNRSRFIQRDFAGEASGHSVAVALALAQMAGPELLESILHHLAAVHEFGGEIYIGAVRDRVYLDQEGFLVRSTSNEHPFATFGYALAYNKNSRVKSKAGPEPDIPYTEFSPPEPPQESDENGAMPEGRIDPEDLKSENAPVVRARQEG